MKLQALIPAVEHAEEAYLGSQMPRITSDLKQGLSAGVEERVVNEPLLFKASGASSRGSVKTAWT
jgi:hypothetical protein